MTERRGEVYVDTSALLALLLRDDRRHRQARRAFLALSEDEAPLVTSSYVLVETYALLQRRVGLDAVSTLREQVAPLLDVTWVGRPLHEAGLDRLARAGRKKLSLVDCVSFELMRRQGIQRAFAYDRHFRGEGFDLL